jgi:hypothetical protein
MDYPTKMKLRADLDDAFSNAWRGRLAKQRECDKLWKNGKTSEADVCRHMAEMLRTIEDIIFDELNTLNKKVGYRP